MLGLHLPCGYRFFTGQRKFRNFKSFMEAFTPTCCGGNNIFVPIWLSSGVGFYLLPPFTFWFTKNPIQDAHSFEMIESYYRVVNEPLESISVDLGFSGNTLAEG